MTVDEKRLDCLLRDDPYLQPYKNRLARRLALFRQAAKALAEEAGSLAGFASGHEYFGLHRDKDQWVFREWAPNATAVYLIGEMSHWKERSPYGCRRLNDHGVWELRLPGHHLHHGSLYRLRIHWDGGSGDRIPAWARRVVQDPQTLIFNAQVWAPERPYRWRLSRYRVPDRPPLIYEVHIGMAQEEGRVGSYAEFSRRVLPLVRDSGYNTLQIMGIPEHPYYGSFGYHVSSFFAPSSRFGTPDEFKALVDNAHAMDLTVLIDLVHSHAAKNEVEGLGRFDGTDYQFFHAGQRGHHPLWDSRLFNYARPEVLHFLLSNCRYWLDEFNVDGFRFDGVTSMLYRHHGIGTAFSGYDDYFDDSVDEDALTYLTLANQIIHELRPDAVTIAEDVSGMPGLARHRDQGGIGFDYRFAMGIPDQWIKLTKDTVDEAWDMGHLWFELTNRRFDERTISYAESHDQALVGDQTLIFRLIGEAMYDHMAADSRHLNVDRGVALHKLIRLITLATAGHGYLTFMGNEFGHPEWIDFPREGNNWSYHYARRQWRLKYDPLLKYAQLDAFDKAMIEMATGHDVFGCGPPRQLWEHNSDKTLIFERANLIFAFNFHPTRSLNDYAFAAPVGEFRIVLNSDDDCFGGHNRVDNRQVHFSLPPHGSQHTPGRLSLYLPNRTALVLEKQP